MKTYQKPTGWKTFYTIWAGQSISTLGTAMSRFALMVWAYQQSSLATTLALLGFFNYGALVLASPIAGVLVDRFSRKKLMLLSDFCSAIMSATILFLSMTNHLQIWHLYVLEALTGVFESIQYPAYQSSITLLLPGEGYTRASSINSLSDSASRILAPVLAALLLPTTGIQSILIIDLASFGFALATLAVSHILQLKETGNPDKKKHWVTEICEGAAFISQRPGLRGLLTIYSFINLFAGLTYYSIISAMILARSGQNALTLSWVESALGLGGVIGGALLTIWGGPRKRVKTLLFATGASFLLGDGSFAFGKTLPIWLFAGFNSTFFIPFITAPNHSIWQSKTPPEIQGRVFSLRGMLQMCTIPIGFLAAGPLADRVFEPAMQPDGVLAPYLGHLIGTGPGTGMAFMFVFTAIGGFLTAVFGYLSRPVRNVEKDLPDANL